MNNAEACLVSYGIPNSTVEKKSITLGLKVLFDGFPTPLSFARTCPRQLSGGFRLLTKSDFLQFTEKKFPRNFTVLHLTSGLLALDRNSARKMFQNLEKPFM